MAKRDASALKQAKSVHFTENNVELPFGKEGMWATATGVAPTGLIAADTQDRQCRLARYRGGERQARVFRTAPRRARWRLVEAEQVVVRNGGLPLPFADVTKVVHDPSFNEILPVEQRRSRERLRAVADGYFNTVELNDGNIFTPFDAECGRLENGILTTAGNAGGAVRRHFAGLRGRPEDRHVSHQQAHPRAPLSGHRRGARRGGGHRLLRPCQRVRPLHDQRRPRDEDGAQVAELDLADRGLQGARQQDLPHRGRVHLRAVFHAQPVLRIPAAVAAAARRSGHAEGEVRQRLPDGARRPLHDVVRGAEARGDSLGARRCASPRTVSGEQIGEGIWGSIRSKSDEALHRPRREGQQRHLVRPDLRPRCAGLGGCAAGRDRRAHQ